MVADDATRGSAEDTVVACKTASSTAYYGPLDAAFGIGRCCDCEK
jgi:hypothetical protein